MRKLLASLAAFVLISMPLFGCNSTGGPTEQGASPPNEPETATAVDTPEDHEKALATMKAIRMMAVTCEAYSIDYGRYPDVRSAAELGKLVDGVYHPTSIEQKDAWGNEFEVSSTEDDYELRSLGRDGKRDNGAPKGLTGDLDADIVFSDAKFIQAPFED